MSDFAKAFAGYEKTPYGWASETTDNPSVPVQYTVQIHNDFGGAVIDVDIDDKQDVVALIDGRIYVEPTRSAVVAKLFTIACENDITICSMDLQYKTDSDTGEHQIAMYCYFLKNGELNYCSGVVPLGDNVPARLHRNGNYNGTKWGVLFTNRQSVRHALNCLMANPKTYCTEQQLGSREVEMYKNN